MSDFLETSELYHHGIKGQKWGERRYQYQDGSLTPEGKRRYGVDARPKEPALLKVTAKGLRKANDTYNKVNRKINKAINDRTKSTWSREP